MTRPETHSLFLQLCETMKRNEEIHMAMAKLAQARIEQLEKSLHLFARISTTEDSAEKGRVLEDLVLLTSQSNPRQIQLREGYRSILARQESHQEQTEAKIAALRTLTEQEELG